MSENKQMVPVTIKISEVKELLRNGYYRMAKDDIGYGSIEAHYSLSPADITELFKHPKLRGLKTRVPSFNLVDDEPDEVVTAKTETGEPTASTAVTAGEAKPATMSETKFDEMY